MPKTLSELEAEIDAQLPDNTSGLITPAMLRGLLKDIIENESGSSGATVSNSIGSSIGYSTVIGISDSIPLSSAVGASIGHSTVSAISNILRAGIGSSTGQSTVAGVGATDTAEISPVFSADLLSLTSLPAEISFSRASTGTYFDASGVLQTAAIDTPRFDHAWNGSAWVAAGLLIEEERTNLALQSADISASSNWTLYGTSIGGSITAPDGTTNMYQLRENMNPGYHYIYQDFTKAAENIQYTLSCYAQITGSRRLSCSIQEPTGANSVNATFDLTNGQIGVPAFSSGTGWSGAEASITPIGGGVYRCTLTGISGTETAAQFAFVLDNGTGTSAWSNNYTGGGVSGAYIGGVQFEVGAFATSYIPTVFTAVTRSADIAQLTGTALAGLGAPAFSVILELGLIGNANPVRFISDVVFDEPLLYTTSDPGTAQNWNGASAVATSNTANWSTGLNRAALGSDSTGRSITLNGGAVATGTGAAASFTSAYLGSDGGSSKFIDGHVRSIAIYDTRLSDLILQNKSVVGASF